METSERVMNNVLQMKVLFGRAKTGHVFANKDGFLEYDSDVDTDGNEGQGLSISQSEVPYSPFICCAGAITQNDNLSNNMRITELVTELYRTESCSLYYGFLNEHIDLFI